MTKMRNAVLILLMCLNIDIFAQNTKDDYIIKFREIAISQMQQSGVPASIILGQACLESGYGTSRLSTEGKNHFGIKCHKSWTGETIFADDDAANECFRKYKSDEESFKDHSDFLRYNNRYAFLFDLAPTDYTAWAHGLKKAGYATNPTYAEALIKVIENNALYLYDKNVKVQIPSPVALTKMELENFVISLNRKIYTRNEVKYVIANEGETYENIAAEFKLTKRQLMKYNDLNKYSAPYAGQELYIKPKKSRASENFPIHIAQKGETMHQIAQKYAVKLSKLYKYNKMKAGDNPEEGQEIFMRNKMKK
ncbi:MAG: glucosaminidase domain-containing protein [Prevotellaceae bacterium]|jgi:LysM repeat protein|nr:glucosaminidase domain-containing protein [Prevotellaceae bacterium]